MKAYILCVAGAVLIAATISLILPSGKMGKFIAGAVRLFVLAVMVTPLLGLVRGKMPEFAERSTVEIDRDYFERSAKALEARDAAEIADFLLERGFTAKIDVERSREPAFPRKKIRIELIFGGIIGEDERIHIVSGIQAEVEARWGCGAEVT